MSPPAHPHPANAEARVMRVALPVPLRTLFDYLPPADGPAPVPGTRVLVAFGKRRALGVVVEAGASASVDSKRLVRAQRVLDEGEPLVDRELLALMDWCARYYKAPPGTVLFHALPPGLRKASGALPGPPSAWALTDEGHERHAQGKGRAPVQWAVLDALTEGPRTDAELSPLAGDWAGVRRRLAEEGWIESRALEPSRSEPVAGPDLNDEQRAAAASITASLGRFEPHLLDGITGSGKTEVYLRAIAEALAAGKQALVLVPEIGLTPQLVRRFRERLGIEPHVAHSGCSEGERLATFAAARRGDARLILGTRSALFLPLPNAGVIILDEEHDPSFKQQEGFRYSARDVAVKRASLLGVPVVLGSATPSLESLHNARQGRYRLHHLRTRATGAALPRWRVLDLRQQPIVGGLAERTLEQLDETLADGHQALVFLNRRGFAPVLLCHDCGWHASCQRCDAHLTWHRSPPSLRCHHCGSRQRVPRVCPECAADALQGAGQGTEQLEQVLSQRFEGVPLLRFDRDAMRSKDAFEHSAEQVRAGEPCLLVGTQMLAKGHHFPDIARVVIVNLDASLFSSDFRALERMGQLMVQVAGRAGRAGTPGEVILQTHHPDNPALQRLVHDGYDALAADLLAERIDAGLPPAAPMAMLRADAHRKEAVLEFLEAAAREFPGGASRLSPPLPALMERRGGRVRWYSLVQGKKRSSLHAQLDRWLDRLEGLPAARAVRWSLDVDPQDL